MGYSITLAGQDITNYVQQLSVKINDTLGQGSGAGNGTAPQGRATTCSMDTILGPMNTAIGAGQPIPPTGSYQAQTTSVASDNFNRGASSSWGTASDGVDAWSLVQGTASFASIVSQQGQITGGSGLQSWQLGTTPDTDSDISLTFQLGTSGDAAGIMARGSGTNYYRAWWANGTGTLSIFKVVSGTATLLASVSLAAFSTGVALNMEFNLTGNVLSCSVWQTTKPGSWQLQYTDTSNTYTSGVSGIVCKPGTSASVMLFDNFNVNVTTQVWVGGAATPYLVRQGELIITDANNVRLFGGYVTKYTDISQNIGPTKVATAIEAIDYSTSLQRIIVDEVFSAQTDIQIIQYCMQKYAPGINLQYLSANGNYTFTVKTFRQVTLEQVIQTVAGVTGFLVWVDYYKNLHYVSPSQASSAPFNLSDNPDFLSTFPHSVQEFMIDDNSAINRVTFYGGQKQSGDIVQDVSPLANGSNQIFLFAAYPLPDSSGHVRCSVNGTFLAIGIANGTGNNNQFKSQGGTADALVDTNGPNITLDVAPATGATVVLYYRYNFPLAVKIADNASYSFFGPPYLDGIITDNTVYDTQTAVQRCKVLLMQQSMGLVTLRVLAYRPGLQSGMTIKVVNNTRGINGTYLIQAVATTALGGGNFQYDVTCGAWNWNIVDIVVKMASLLNPPDLQNQGAVTSVILESVNAQAAIHDVWSQTEHTHGGYYARASAVGDGHDAYPGFFTIAS